MPYVNWIDDHHRTQSMGQDHRSGNPQQSDFGQSEIQKGEGIDDGSRKSSEANLTFGFEPPIIMQRSFIMPKFATWKSISENHQSPWVRKVSDCGGNVILDDSGQFVYVFRSSVPARWERIDHPNISICPVLVGDDVTSETAKLHMEDAMKLPNPA